MEASRRRLAAAGVAVGVVIAAVAAWAWPGGTSDKPALGLFTSLPIYWSENGSVSEALDGGGERHWVRTTLENSSQLVPLDTLNGGEMSRIDDLLMAQPRPLAPAENVALDHWVREGGRLLLFADPFLTEESRFALGDKRRPQDVVLLSPILRRWGLELTFDEDQPQDERTIGYGSTELPVRLAGRLVAMAPGAPAACTITAGQLVAECKIGTGSALVVADAALLEADRSPDEARPALSALMARAFNR